MCSPTPKSSKELSRYVPAVQLDIIPAHVSTRIRLKPWSRVLPEKLTGPQLLKKCPAFYATRKSITAFTTARHLSLSCTRQKTGAWFLGILHGVRGEFPDDVSGTAVGPIFTSHTVQNP
jgi:hypothetical protein